MLWIFVDIGCLILVLLDYWFTAKGIRSKEAVVGDGGDGGGNRDSNWIRPSTNARLIILLASQLLFAISEYNSKKKFGISFLVIVTAICVTGITLVFQFRVLRIFKFVPTDDNCRLSSLILGVCFFVFAQSCWELSFHCIFVAELLTLVNPMLVWKTRHKIKVNRPKLLLFSVVLGHLLFVVCAVMIAANPIQEYGSGTSYSKINVIVYLFVPILLYFNNEHSHFLSRCNNNDDDDDAAENPIAASYNQLSSGIQCINMIQVALSFVAFATVVITQYSVEQGCLFLLGTLEMNQASIGDSCLIAAWYFPAVASRGEIAFCFFALVRMILQQLAFSDAGRNRIIADSPYKHYQGRKKIYAFLSSWKGQHVISSINFATNAVFFFIATTRDLYPNASMYPASICCIATAGCVVNLHSFVYRRSKWKTLKKLLPCDDNLRFTVLLKSSILGFKTVTIIITSVNSGVGSELSAERATLQLASDIILIVLTIASLIVIGITATVNVVKLWPLRKTMIPVAPHPKLLLIGYACMFWCIQISTIALIVSSKNSVGWICPAKFNFLTMPEEISSLSTCSIVYLSVTISVMGLVVSCNEIARYLQTFNNELEDDHVQQPAINNNTNFGGIHSLDGFVCFNPFVFVVCATAIVFFYNQLLVTLTCGCMVLSAALAQAGVTTFGSSKQRKKHNNNNNNKDMTEELLTQFNPL